MPKEGQFFIYFNKNELLQLIERFGTTNKKELGNYLKETALKIETILNPQSQKEKLVIKNLEKKNIALDISNKIKLIQELKMSPAQAMDIATGRKELEIEPLNEQGLACPDCNWKTDSTCSNKYQHDSMISHLKELHGRLPAQDEQDILLEFVTK